MQKPIDHTKLNQALQLLQEQLELADAPRSEIVVCGGSALIAIGLVSRTTRDIDIVALLHNGRLQQSEPLPRHLVEAAAAVQEILHLPADWLNCGTCVPGNAASNCSLSNAELRVQNAELPFSAQPSGRAW